MNNSKSEIFKSIKGFLDKKLSENEIKKIITSDSASNTLILAGLLFCPEETLDFLRGRLSEADTSKLSESRTAVQELLFRF